MSISGNHVSLIALSVCLLALAVVLAGATACSGRKVPEGKLGVVVSILPLVEFTEAVGGDKVDVSVMVPPGAEPHTYEPTPSQMVNVSNASVFVKVGSGVEFELTWMDKIVQANESMLVVDGSVGIELMESEDVDVHEHEGESEEVEHEHGGLDPHIWTSAVNAITMVGNICDGLVQLDPDNRDYYEQNRDSYIEKLEALDADIRREMAQSGSAEFLVFHPAWAYFARDYGMKEIAIEVGGKEPSAGDIANVIDAAKARGIKVVFVEPQFNSQSAEVIARAIDGVVISIDPLARDYIDNLRNVASELTKTGM